MKVKVNVASGILEIPDEELEHRTAEGARELINGRVQEWLLNDAQVAWVFDAPSVSATQQQSNARHHPPGRIERSIQVLDDIHANPGRVHAVVRRRLTRY
jgi:hypothetical protein